MAQQKQPAERQKEPKQSDKAQRHEADTAFEVPQPESSSEYEGAPSREPTGNPPEVVKTESSSEYEGAPSREPTSSPPNAAKAKTSPRRANS